MVRLHLRLEGERLPYRIRSARLPEWGPEPSLPLRHCLRDSSSLWDAVPSPLGRKCYGSTLALHAISGSSTLPRPSSTSFWRILSAIMPSMEAFDAAVAYVLSSGIDIQVYLGALFGGGHLIPSDASGNGRFFLDMVCSVPGAQEYLNLVFFPMLSLLAPRFRASMELAVRTLGQGDQAVNFWFMQSSRSPHWDVLYQVFYVDGMLELPQWAADDLCSQTFLAYFAMGTGMWDPEHGILFHASHLHPDSRAPLQSVFLRHGVATTDLGGASGCHLLVRREDTASLLCMQALARAHFCPGMLGLAGLGPDGAPL